jgi:hypothetical protein
MPRTSTRRPPAGRSVLCALRVHNPSAGEGPPAGLPQPRRRPACRMTPAGREAGQSPSPCGPKPPSGDGSVGVGPKALGLPPALRPACANASEGRPRAFRRRAEAFAQAGRRAKSTESMLPAFDYGVAPRLPLSWPTPQYRLPRYGVAGLQVAPGWEDDAALLATASSRLGRGTTGANSAQGCEAQKRTKCLFRAPAQSASVRGERPKHGIPA